MTGQTEEKYLVSLSTLVVVEGRGTKRDRDDAQARAFSISRFPAKWEKSYRA